MQKLIPSSAVPRLTILAGVVGAMLSCGLAIVSQLPPALTMVGMILMTACPMWHLERQRTGPRREVFSAGWEHDRNGVSRRRMALVGAASALAMIAASIQLQSTFGHSHSGALPEVTLVLIPIALLWMGWLCFRGAKAGDGPGSVEQWGLVVWNAVRRGQMDGAGRQLLLGWCVKAFFLPLMLAWLYVWVETLDSRLRDGHGWFAVFSIGMALLYALDTLFATIGYVSTSRKMDAHIRSTDSTWLGWAAALVCYPPASDVVLRQWLNYKDGIEWFDWIDIPWLKFAWGSAILLLTAVYTAATVVFGPRFSNLTNRGIVTAGPFRWTKHPAYISKNLSWWLIAVPFVSNQGGLAAALNCLGLLGVNAIYWLRAKTEERHLMVDPTYRAYSAWIAENGLFARVKRIFFLSPSIPK